jgi:hypothetical protein
MEETTTQAADWKQSIPNEFKSEACLSNIQDLPSLVKSYVHGQKRLGSAINIPGQNATDDEKNEFLKKLGRPDSPDKYTTLDFAGLPDGLSHNEEFIKKFREASHASGLSDAQQRSILQNILKYEMEAAKNATMTEEASFQKAQKELRTKLGEAYDQRVSMAKKAYETFIPEAARERFREMGLENDPDFIVGFSSIGEKMMEDRSIDGTGGANSLVMTPDEAKSEIAKIRSNPEHPYVNRKFEGTPERQMAAERMQRLYSLAYPKSQ